MKSKPPSKKIKVEVTTLGPPVTPDKTSTTVVPSVSPASSSVSSSSLLSIGPQSYPLSIRPDVSAIGLLATPGGKASGGKKGGSAKDAAKGGASDQAAVGPLPSLTHFNLTEFPKINACIVGKKGGAMAALAAAASLGLGDMAKPIDALTMEDLDPLQAELETLWSNVATRIRLLNREQSSPAAASSTSHGHNIGLEHFDPQHQEKIASVAAIIDHGTRTSVSAAAKLVMGVQIGTGNSPVPSPSPAVQAVPTPGTKRTTAKGERLPKKKLKGEGAGGGKSKKAGDKPAARATQNRSHSVSSDIGPPAADGVLKHHEVPAQFWDWVDVYCRDLVKEDVDNLQTVLDEQAVLPADIFDIPPLGKHFKDDEDTAIKKAKESRMNSTRDCVGPLTQRLVSALVDERVSMFNNNHLNSPKEDASLAISANNNPEGGYFIHRHGLVRHLGLDSGGNGVNTPSLENRIRDCLVDHGLLPPDDANDPILMNPDDEILAEIKRTQATLKKLHSYNQEKLSGVIEEGKRAIERNVHKRELEKADKEVFEAFKNISSCRQRKKPITKKDKDAATKSLEARKRALQKLGTIRSIDNGMGMYGRSTGSGSAMSAQVAPVDPTGLLRVQV